MKPILDGNIDTSIFRSVYKCYLIIEEETMQSLVRTVTLTQFFLSVCYSFCLYYLDKVYSQPNGPNSLLTTLGLF